MWGDKPSVEFVTLSMGLGEGPLQSVGTGVGPDVPARYLRTRELTSRKRPARKTRQNRTPGVQWEYTETRLLWR